MKKVMAILLALCMPVALMACGNAAPDDGAVAAPR